MKKLITLALSLALTLTMSAHMSAAELTALKGTPVIDGKIDEIYKQSTGTLTADQSTYVWHWGNGRDNSKASATSYILHDGSYLYVATEVKNDKTLVDAKIIEGWKADSAEIWIKFPGQEKNAKIAVDAFNTKIYGDAFGVDFSKCKSATTRSTDSYIVEVAIPLDGFKTGDKLPISLQFNDCLEAEATNGAAWGSQKAENTVLLSDTAVTLPKPAPATADIGIISAAASLAASALVIFKKKR